MKYDIYYKLVGHEVVKAEGYEDATWDPKLRRVAFDTVNGSDVSTVFLTIDHNWNPNGRPILFETMVFGAEGSEPCWRYHTWEEAEAGHYRVVAALAAGLDPEREDIQPLVKLADAIKAAKK